MAFSDLFSADNLAKLGTGLNQGIGNLTSTPLGQFGINMLANSGYRADNAGMGERLGLALQGASQMQQQQALQQYRRDQIATEQARQHQLQQAAQQKVEQQQRYQQAIQNPDFLSQLSPMARQFAQLGVDPGELLRAQSADNLQTHRDAQMAQQQSQFEERMAHLSQGGGGGSKEPKAPMPRQIIEEPLANNMVQRHIYDTQTGQYKPYGEPYPRYAPPKANPWDALTGDGADTQEGASVPLTPPNPALPGTGGLQSYAPQPQHQPLVMAGATPERQPNPNSVEALAQAAAPAANRSSGGPATPKTRADYDALPSGAKYIDPASGRVATKR